MLPSVPLVNPKVPLTSKLPVLSVPPSRVSVRNASMVVVPLRVRCRLADSLRSLVR